MKVVQIFAMEFPNPYGDIIIGITGKDDHRMFFIKTSDGIFEYSVDEVEEIYGFVPQDTSIIGIKAK